MQQYIPKKDSKINEEKIDIDEEIRLMKVARKRRKRWTLSVTIALLVIMSSLIVYSVTAPGRYDDFAKCLTEKGAEMYGEDWCRYTQAQKAMFGKSFKYINYQVKTDLNRRPTWIIDGKKYETVQSFERLASLTGCSI